MKHKATKDERNQVRRAGIEAEEFQRTGYFDMERTGELRSNGEDDRRVWVACSSEEPVERYFGPEVLIHTDEAIDVSFLGSSRAPVLLDHGARLVLG